MNIGLFTDTYYPQVSGVATSIKTLRAQLERKGHNVYIFTTTDPNVDKSIYERNIFRFASIPFISFTDRRIAIRGLFQAYQVAKELNLDIVHTQTEFSMGLIGKFVAKNLKIPCVHTYHTMYEDYLHYIAKGHLLKPYHVKQITKTFCYHLSGVIAPSTRVLETLDRYGIKVPISVIPTGVDLSTFNAAPKKDLRAKYHLTADTPVILTLSRLAFEKNIDQLIEKLPAILNKVPNAKLIICGDGPAKETLQQQVEKLNLTKQVIFTGEINNEDVVHYYRMADVFASTSVSESQGLTYIEALAAKVKVVAKHSPYTDELLDDPSLGQTVDDEQLVDVIADYLLNPNKYHNPVLLEQKLAGISAETFADKVLDFYLESKKNYLNYLTNRSSEHI